MTIRANYLGRQFIRWTVESWDHEARKWNCVCACGNRGLISSARLLNGATKSCGCLAQEQKTIHGHARKRNRSTTYQAWYSMIQRVTNPRTKQFKDYGGRGIVVCNERRDFTAFLADMGERPTGLLLDRIDNDKGYSKGNCRWATRSQQQTNQRRTQWLTIDGAMRPLAELAREAGLYPALVRNRIANGWSPERALRAPVT
jgi:hypothetical protein